MGDASPSPPAGALHASQWLVRLSALGIVFGDLGTSPLYTLQTVVQASGGRFTAEGALGILSLLVWTLLITVSLKYCVLVMRADNRGEGGILALMSLVGANGFTRGVRHLAIMGLLGAALIYGDGAITPAISVLSALEGVNVVTTAFKPYVMPAAVLVLLSLFAVQRYGTERIGKAFGPVMLLWFLVIGSFGALAVAHHPGVLVAIDPRYAVRFLVHAGMAGFLVLGGVFLCVTGGEALYADMGHFGRGAIRFAWYAVVLPALLLSYAGQVGLLIDRGSIEGNPFFQIVPIPLIYPMVLLATIATIIASQSIITGSYSMTRQAMQLGWLPGVSIRQTSDRVYGQIYVPVVNWLMMVATVAITIGFGSSDRLAGAYGTAVATTMMLTTGLLFVAMRDVWRWPLAAAITIGGGLLFVDVLFFVANLFKIMDGGWLPIALALVIFALMITWRSGFDAVRASLALMPESPDAFLARLRSGAISRVAGTTVFLTRSSQPIPRLVMDYVHFAGALPERVIALHVQFEEVPRAAAEMPPAIEQVGEGLWHMVAHFGFMEIPDLRAALRNATGISRAVDVDCAVFVGARDHVVPRGGSSALRGRSLALFAFLYRNAAKPFDRFNLPAANTVEIARQIEV